MIIGDSVITLGVTSRLGPCLGLDGMVMGLGGILATLGAGLGSCGPITFLSGPAGDTAGVTLGLISALAAAELTIWFLVVLSIS